MYPENRAKQRLYTKTKPYIGLPMPGGWWWVATGDSGAVMDDPIGRKGQHRVTDVVFAEGINP